MRAPYTQLYVHLVWATWDRWPWLGPDLRPAVYSAIQAQANGAGADIVAIGGMPDHVHVVTRFPTTISIADLVRRLKGATSHLMTHEVRPGESFRWQGGYGAFTVSRAVLPRVRDYVLNQEQHHGAGSLHAALEATQEP
ncbi:MAG: transposase IS200-family protein [Gemmatimonadetes bacterium]|nr:transposase IS200-family protein [Gemmatimonadota bacterium]